MVDVRKIVAVPIALAILYIMLTTLVLPNFAKTYETCGNDAYSAGRGGTSLTNDCCTTSTATVTACTNCNISSGYSTFLSTCGSLIAVGNGTHCYSCSAFAYKTTNQGLLLLVLVIALLGFAVAFLKYFKK